MHICIKYVGVCLFVLLCVCVYRYAHMYIYIYIQNDTHTHTHAVHDFVGAVSLLEDHRVKYKVGRVRYTSLAQNPRE